MMNIKELLAKLIAFESVTPNDAGCQEFIIAYLEQLGFECLRLNNLPVANFFARLGNTEPLLLFAGHTDVVPVGNNCKWNTSPFVLTEKEGFLYGRGVADMKGSLAAMMYMASDWSKSNVVTQGSLGFLITSGEEGDHFNLGTPYVMAQLAKLGIKAQFCIVGEPSSTTKVGDVIKIGRRGSLNGRITIHGKQGHVAYPHLADNPIHTASAALAELTDIRWDEGNAYFPPTSLQITHIHAGGEANNIIPGELVLCLNIRFSTEQNSHGLKEQIVACFNRHGLSPTFEWQLSGEPFITSQGKLLSNSIKAVKEVTILEPALSTSGGTSDGRFIAPYGVEVIELGPVNSTIHQVNEKVSLADLEQLAKIYYSIAKKLLL